MPLNVDPSIAPPDEPDPVLGRVVRRLREEQGLSQADVANRAQVELATLARIEDGAVDPPWATVEAVARGLGLPVRSIAAAVAEQRDQAGDR